jgi:hypothetical protein
VTKYIHKIFTAYPEPTSNLSFSETNNLWLGVLRFVNVLSVSFVAKIPYSIEK